MIIRGVKSECPPKAKLITCTENNMRYVAHNDRGDHVSKFHVDGAVIKDENIQKCDYLVTDDTRHLAIFIELKGRHISHALKQLDNTEKLLCSDLKDYPKHFYRIVCTSVSGGFSAEEKKWLKKHRGDLQKGSRFYEDWLDKL